MAPEVLLPTSPAEVVAAFGDGAGTTVLGGGTIVVPEITYGRLQPGRVLVLARSGLDEITRSSGTVTIGAGVPVSALEGGDEPLASAAAHVGDPEILAQATVGGNLCAGPGDEAPRGDLQAPLIALGARVRSTGAGGERVEPVEDFLSAGRGRLVLDVSYDVPEAAGYAAAWRPHAHHFTILAAACARSGGRMRVAVTGAGPRGVGCPSVEKALAKGADLAAASQQVLDDVEHLLVDDALASAWYRKRILPNLVQRAIEEAR